MFFRIPTSQLLFFAGSGPFPQHPLLQLGCCFCPLFEFSFLYCRPSAIFIHLVQDFLTFFKLNGGLVQSFLTLFQLNAKLRILFLEISILERQLLRDGVLIQFRPL